MKKERRLFNNGAELVDTNIKPLEHHIDGQPDGNYALRILQYYRLRCNEKIIISGEGTVNIKRVYDIMNEHQDQRAKELDKAIKVLEETK